MSKRTSKEIFPASLRKITSSEYKLNIWSANCSFDAYMHERAGAKTKAHPRPESLHSVMGERSGVVRASAGIDCSNDSASPDESIVSDISICFLPETI